MKLLSTQSCTSIVLFLIQPSPRQTSMEVVFGFMGPESLHNDEIRHLIFLQTFKVLLKLLIFILFFASSTICLSEI